MDREDRQAQKGGKRDRSLRGVQDIKTGRSERIHSVPRRDDNYYLDLFLLKKERERLEKEVAWVDKKRKRVQDTRKDVQKRIAALEEKVLEGMSILQRPPPDRASRPEGKESAGSDEQQGKKLTKMTLDY